LDTRFPAIADYLLSQEAELTRLRGENVKLRNFVGATFHDSHCGHLHTKRCECPRAAAEKLIASLTN